MGGKFTWLNNYLGRTLIWKRLDKVVVNERWLQKYSQTIVKNLTVEGSYHKPILVRTRGMEEKLKRPFHFFKSRLQLKLTRKMLKKLGRKV